MRYLPILQELFESDTVMFFLAGLVAALLLTLGRKKRGFTGSWVCLLVYAACEVLCNVHTNYLIEILALMVGTLTLGGAAGCLAGAGLERLRRK